MQYFLLLSRSRPWINTNVFSQLDLLYIFVARSSQSQSDTSWQWLAMRFCHGFNGRQSHRRAELLWQGCWRVLSKMAFRKVLFIDLVGNTADMALSPAWGRVQKSTLFLHWFYFSYVPQVLQSLGLGNSVFWWRQVCCRSPNRRTFLNYHMERCCQQFKPWRTRWRWPTETLPSSCNVWFGRGWARSLSWSGRAYCAILLFYLVWVRWEHRWGKGYFGLDMHAIQVKVCIRFPLFW